MCAGRALPNLEDVPLVRRWRVYLFDALLASAMVLLSLPRLDPSKLDGDRTVATWWGFTALLAAGLLIQHRWPLPALLLTCVGATGHQIVLDSHVPHVEFPMVIDLSVLIILYTFVSRSRSRRLSLAVLATMIAAEIAIGLANPLISAADPVRKPKDNAALEGIELLALRNKVVTPGLTVLLALALAYALGEGTRSRHAHLRTLEQHAADLEKAQVQRIALATEKERARIGRELHDVVAHSLTVIVAQAQAAIAAQQRHPERTTQALHEVITVGRESLAEMRRVVGAFGPVPEAGDGLAALPLLVDRVRAAGTPVDLAVDGAVGNLPAGVNLSAYRIVQEALTNTLKHAGPGAHASVRLAVRPEYVDIEVTDDGAGSPADPPASDGNGLRGIAERVHLLGGALSVGAVPGGGFAVRARLPVGAPS
jgi:signal transduction histidine kinase